MSANWIQLAVELAYSVLLQLELLGTRQPKGTRKKMVLSVQKLCTLDVAVSSEKAVKNFSQQDSYFKIVRWGSFWHNCQISSTSLWKSAPESATLGIL